jgi:hypothetical protein
MTTATTAAVAVTEPSSTNYTTFILGQIRGASLRSRLLTAEIDSIGVALRGNFIGPDDAIAWLDEAGGLNLITTMFSSDGKE